MYILRFGSLTYGIVNVCINRKRAIYTIEKARETGITFARTRLKFREKALSLQLLKKNFLTIMAENYTIPSSLFLLSPYIL